MNNNKKVYTTTFHLANNYGAMLQAYALQKFLLLNGFDTQIINYDNYKISDHYRILKKDRSNIIKFFAHILPRLSILFREIKKEKNFSEYRKKLKLTKYVSEFNDVMDIISDGDTIICGSDQIWNPSITNGFDKVYYLQFENDNINTISYAASCGGINRIENKKIFQSYLKKIKHISVREDELCNEIKKSNINARVVLDPSLLLSKEEWISDISDKRIVEEKYIFTYSVDNGNDLYYKTINNLANKYGYTIVYFDKFCSEIKCKKKNFYSAGPDTFLNLLYHSEFVITTSFHGFALSCVLNKKVFPILSSYPDRLKTLANNIGLDKIFVNDIGDLKKLDIKEINWDEINKKIIEKRIDSIDWLLECINNLRN